jgi:hemerythrin superfamily protein
VNGIDLLKDDHDKIKKLMTDGQQKGEDEPKSRRRIFEEIKRDMTVHEQIEEQIFYPALRSHPKAKGMVLEGIEEHNVVDSIMGDLEITEPDDEYWGAKFKVMKEDIEHHIGDEENEMFPTAKQIFSTDELDELGTRMQQMKQAATASYQQ